MAMKSRSKSKSKKKRSGEVPDELSRPPKRRSNHETEDVGGGGVEKKSNSKSNPKSKSNSKVKTKEKQSNNKAPDDALPPKKSANSEHDTDNDSGNDNDNDGENANASSATDDPCLDLLGSDKFHPAYDEIETADKLLRTKDYRNALKKATDVLEGLPPLPLIAGAALVRGRVLRKLAENFGKDDPRRKDLCETARIALDLSCKLDPDCREATSDDLKIIAHLEKDFRPTTLKDADVDVLIVGAGAAGIGVAHMLTHTFGMDTSNVLVVERGADVGQSFRDWPKEMRFISPSFNQQGWTDSFDLNAIAHGTSPAYSLHSEHPSGEEYASYLSAIAATDKLRIRTHTEVAAVRPIGDDISEDSDADEDPDVPLFSVELRSLKGKRKRSKFLTARYVIWAAGEFQYPKISNPAATGKDSEDKQTLVGMEHCLHNSKVRSWAELEGDERVVIGGYESGIDATVNLAKAGKKCTVLASTPCWNVQTADPSAELAPYTAGRLRDVLVKGFDPKPKLRAPLRAVRVEKATSGGFDIHAEWLPDLATKGQGPLRDAVLRHGRAGKPGSTLVVHTAYPPVLCTGFQGSVAAAAKDLFDLADGGCSGAGTPKLTEDDESTKTPGVFLVGPSVVHAGLSFCFVYKFRQRFAVVADAICQGLRMDTSAAVAECRSANMYLDDLGGCGDTCGDVCG